MAENFTPSAGSRTQSLDLQPEVLAVRIKKHPMDAPISCMNLTALSFMEVLSRCYGTTPSHALDMLFHSSMSFPAKERRRTEHSPPFCLKKHPGKLYHMPEFKGFVSKILGV